MPTIGSATLVLHGPAGKLRHEIFTERTTIGRSADNDVVVRDSSVSSRHCELVLEPRGLVVRDLDSANGTWVNGQRAREAVLHDGDVLRIGQHQGRMAVRRPDGYPLLRPVSRRPQIVAAIAFAGVLAAGLALTAHHRAQRAADKATFAAYEEALRRSLDVEGCARAEEPSRRLRALEADEPRPEAGRRGRLRPAERAQNARLLEIVREKRQIVHGIVAEAAAFAAGQREAAAQLGQWSGRFHDRQLAQGIAGLGPLHAQRVRIAENFAEGWRRYLLQTEELAEILELLLRDGDPSAADRLDGFRYRSEPLRLIAECQERTGRAREDGWLRLATLAP